MSEKDERNMALCSSMRDENHDDEKDANHIISDSRIPFIFFFDEWMKKKMKKTAEDGTKKSYKDYVFYWIGEEEKLKDNMQDPPMKIINGKILKTNSVGGSRGYLVDIVKDYLNETFPSEIKKRKVVFLESLSNPIEETDDGDAFTLEDKIASPQKVGGPSFESAEIYHRLFPPVKNDAQKMQYQRAEKIILFATAYKVKISNPTLNSILGGKKVFASNRREELFKKLQEIIENDESELSLLLGLSQLVFEEFQENNKNGTEKEAFEYLCMLRDRDSNRNDGPTQISAESEKGYEG